MAELPARPGCREVRDVYGRPYLIGESDRELLGHSRRWVFAAAWLAMLAVSANQYGFGVFAPALARAHGWGLQPVFWGFALWVCCHSAATGGVAWLRRRVRFAPRTAVVCGAVCCALGLAALGHFGDPAAAVVCYGLACGTGTGLVYGSCLATMAGWYPDRPIRTAAVSGAFAYGAIPLILITTGVSDLTLSLDQAAFVMLVVLVACAALLREAPPNWWPADLDPQRWAIDRRLHPTLRHDRPAIRQHSVIEVLRSRTTWPLATLAVCVAAVALFDTGYLTLYGLTSGWSLPLAAGGMAAFAAGSGAVRMFAVGAAGRVGWSLVLRVALCLGAVAQLVLLAAGPHRLLPVFLLAACGAGAATGSWYALFPGLVRSHFGDLPGLPNLWLLYSAKALGSVIGIGCGGLLVAIGHGYPAAFALSAALCLAAVGFARLLHQPGMPRTLPELA